MLIIVIVALVIENGRLKDDIASLYNRTQSQLKKAFAHTAATFTLDELKQFAAEIPVMIEEEMNKPEMFSEIGKDHCSIRYKVEARIIEILSTKKKQEEIE